MEKFNGKEYVSNLAKDTKKPEKFLFKDINKSELYKKNDELRIKEEELSRDMEKSADEEIASDDADRDYERDVVQNFEKLGGVSVQNESVETKEKKVNWISIDDVARGIRVKTNLIKDFLKDSRYKDKYTKGINGKIFIDEVLIDHLKFNLSKETLPGNGGKVFNKPTLDYYDNKRDVEAPYQGKFGKWKNDDTEPTS